MNIKMFNDIISKQNITNYLYPFKIIYKKYRITIYISNKCVTRNYTQNIYKTKPKDINRDIEHASTRT